MSDDEAFFWTEYKRSESVAYEDLNPLEKAVVGLANFGGMACMSGISEQVYNVGAISLRDSEDALRRR